ncbi:MAG: ATP-binding cassette domain-containing protein [Lactobacillaceae bacterium]|jgi:ABC-type lipoprotein export system ATPase subunit/ABC-type antimicrobial peptide transport system permease subunit|nr:ATP-binding cassette domain-containing protein [Lactobacillaceae bacterium]
MAYFELKDIKKSYRLNKNEVFPVLKGINLQFEKGEMVSILGESGGGKSTLLNILGGLDHDYEGDVILDGQSTKDFTEKQMDGFRRQTIGFIFQNFNLISHLTLLDNVKVALEMTELSPAERTQRAKELLEQVGLKDHVKKYPNQISGGQKQRVAIARALASNADIIIADEPTGALDSTNTAEVLEILENIAKDGKLVLMVTHSQDVANYGTRIVHISDGIIDSDTKNRKKYPVPAAETKLKSKPLSAAADYIMAYKHLMHNFWRNFLIMLGTGIGIFAVILFSVLGNGINAFINDQINSIVNPKMIAIVKNTSGKKMSSQKAQESISQASANPTQIFINQDLIDRIKKLDHVKKVEAGYQFSTYQLIGNSKTVSARGLMGYSDTLSKNSIKHGDAPKTGEMIISNKQATELFGGWKKAIGQTVNVTFTWINDKGMPVQVSTDVKISGTVSDEQTSFTSINTQTIKEALQKAGATTDSNYVISQADSMKNVKKAAAEINNLKVDGKYALASITVGSVLDTVNDYVGVASMALQVIAGISLVVSALMIIVTMYMSVSERTKEIGVLRALGAGKKDVRRLFTAESLLIGLFSAVLALALSYGIGFFINQALYSIVKFNMVQVTGMNVLSAFIIALVIAYIAALLPANRAANLDPIESLAAE